MIESNRRVAIEGYLITKALEKPTLFSGPRLHIVQLYPYSSAERKNTGLRMHPWANPELYWRYAPMASVQHIRTPLLIVHSEEDLRYPMEQAEQLFTALKQRRREVRFVRCPGENHELSRSGKPSHRVQRFGYILDWFAAKPRAPLG